MGRKENGDMNQCSALAFLRRFQAIFGGYPDQVQRVFISGCSKKQPPLAMRFIITSVLEASIE
jgi:hypothetical protein